MREIRPAVHVLAALIVAAAVLPHCGSERQQKAPQITSATLSISQMKNMAYEGFDGLDTAIVLTEGTWEGEPYDEGSPVRPRITFAGDFRLDGDLDGDGDAESAVLLYLSPGGSGQFLYLCVVDLREGRPLNVATALIGDRVQIRSGKVIDNNILLDIVEAGPADGACCPGQLMTYGWSYAAKGALERSTLSDVPGRLTLDVLHSQEWVLRFWGADEMAPVKPVVFLSYVGGRIAGSSGCNRFFASVSEGETPGDIVIGPVGSTQMACPEEEMRVEGRFLANLATVTKFGFMLGRLALTYQGTEGPATMLFERR